MVSKEPSGDLRTGYHDVEGALWIDFFFEKEIEPKTEFCGLEIESGIDKCRLNEEANSESICRAIEQSVGRGETHGPSMLALVNRSFGNQSPSAPHPCTTIMAG